MRKIYLLFVFLSFCASAGAQNNQYWSFGMRCAVVFDSSGPHAVPGKITVLEGTSSISDGCGLLFYTNGDTVWDRNHVMMPNAAGLAGKCKTLATSGTQNSLIVRVPSSDSLFYIFTTDCIEDYLADGLRYSVVNMRRNNGLGEVVEKNMPLLPNAEEKITAARHSNGCDIWIIGHEYRSNRFFSYKLSSSGLDTVPAISATGQKHNSPNPNYYNARGYLKASPDGKKLINVNPDGAYSWADSTLPELFTFDQQTGSVSSELIFPKDTSFWWASYSSWTVPFYGATFSPDNSKLYLSSGFYGPNLYQYDLKAGNPASILASRTYLPNSYSPSNGNPVPSAMVNAPDGKIYIAQRWKGFLGVISNPNAAAPLCNYQDSGFDLPADVMNHWGGLPNFFEDYINPKLLKADFTTTRSLLKVKFINKSVDGVSYTWDFGDGSSDTSRNPQHVYSAGGYYTVNLFAKSNGCDVDRICKTIYVEAGDNDGDRPGNAGGPDFEPGGGTDPDPGPGPDPGSGGSGGCFSAVYPNPFNEILTLRSNTTGNRMHFYDMLGKYLFEIRFDGTQKVTLPMLAPGMYLYRLENDRGCRWEGKLIKML